MRTVDKSCGLCAVQGVGGLECTVVKALENFQLVQHVDSSLIRIAFEPGKQVTGYQLLVMLLRTLGYGKENEFADPMGWELQTAKIAEREGILKNTFSSVLSKVTLASSPNRPVQTRSLLRLPEAGMT